MHGLSHNPTSSSSSICSLAPTDYHSARADSIGREVKRIIEEKGGYSSEPLGKKIIEYLISHQNKTFRQNYILGRAHGIHETEPSDKLASAMTHLKVLEKYPDMNDRISSILTTDQSKFNETFTVNRQFLEPVHNLLPD